MEFGSSKYIERLLWLIRNREDSCDHCSHACKDTAYGGEEFHYCTEAECIFELNLHSH